MYACGSCVYSLWKPEEGIRSGTGVTRWPCGWWESNPGPLKEQLINC